MSSWPNMKNRLSHIIKTQHAKPFFRYFIMAGVIVVIEVSTFAFMNSSFKINYLLATPLSNVVAIALNWYFSRVYAFRGRNKHKTHVEFTLITVVSVIGVGIQTAVTAISVELLSLTPLAGKVIAIVVTFFWSYWVRRRFIFKREL